MDLGSVTQLIDREIAQIDADHPNAPHQHSQPPRTMEERGMVIRCDPYPDRASRYKCFKDLLQKENVDEVMQTLKTGELRGMGGAGFPTFIKWDATRKSPGHTKYVVCNADESEPGTIKDRFILQYLPHMVIEGMMLCGALVERRRATFTFATSMSCRRRSCAMSWTTSDRKACSATTF